MRGGKGLGISLEEQEHLVGEGDPAKKPEEEIKELRDKPGDYSVQGVKEANVFFKNDVIKKFSKLNSEKIKLKSLSSLRHGGHMSSIVFGRNCGR